MCIRDRAYPASYNECVDQAKKECGEGFKPQLAGALPDVSKYDVVFVLSLIHIYLMERTKNWTQFYQVWAWDADVTRLSLIHI